MLAIQILTVLIYFILISCCLFLVVIGLPGTWILLGIGLLIEVTREWVLPGVPGPIFGWGFMILGIALALLGEVLEFLAGVLGAKKFGASTRGMVGAFGGGIVGAILGIGIPIPVLGSILGALIGTFVGAYIGEASIISHEKRDHFKPATGAALGKILGIASKFPIAVSVWLIFLTRIIYVTWVR